MNNRGRKFRCALLCCRIAVRCRPSAISINFNFADNCAVYSELHITAYSVSWPLIANLTVGVRPSVFFVTTIKSVYSQFRPTVFIFFRPSSRIRSNRQLQAFFASVFVCRRLADHITDGSETSSVRPPNLVLCILVKEWTFQNTQALFTVERQTNFMPVT